MPSLQIHALYDASAPFFSESWEVMPVYPNQSLRQGSLQAIWSSLSATDAEIEIEVSNDNINWNCYGGAVPVTLTPANDNQLFEFKQFDTRYVRLKYTPNTVTSGTLKIITHGAP